MTSSKSTRRAKPASPPEPAPSASPSKIASTKLDQVVTLLRRPGGVTLAELQAATGWQAHSVRGALAGAVKKRLALPITSTKEERGRVYRVSAEPTS